MKIKGQALTDFIAKFTYADTTKVARTASNTETTKLVEMGNDKKHAIVHDDVDQWILYVDGASNENGFGAGKMQISPKEHKIHSALRFEFFKLNNDSEYEALIAGLHLAKDL